MGKDSGTAHKPLTLREQFRIRRFAFSYHDVRAFAASVSFLAKTNSKSPAVACTYSVAIGSLCGHHNNGYTCIIAIIYMHGTKPMPPRESVQVNKSI